MQQPLLVAPSTNRLWRAVDHLTPQVRKWIGRRIVAAAKPSGRCEPSRGTAFVIDGLGMLKLSRRRAVSSAYSARDHHVGLDLNEACLALRGVFRPCTSRSRRKTPQHCAVGRQ
jgi:hypothetical protein